MRLFPKIMLLMTVSLLGSVLIVSGLFYWTEQLWIRNDEQAKQQVLLQSLAHIAAESVVTNDDLLLVKFTQMLQTQTPEMISASVTDVGGRVRVHSEPKRIGQSLRPSESSAALLLSQPVRVGKRVYGTASITFSQKHLDARLQAQLNDLKRRMAPAMVIVLALVCPLAFWLSLTWTRPIRRIVRGTEEIGRGNYKTSLAPVDERTDELGDVAQAIKSMAGQLGELDEMKEDFVTAVTHELRSPLGAIETFLNMMQHDKEQKGLPSTWDTYHTRIRANVQRLTRFINDLLDVAALDRGKVELSPQMVDLAAMVRQTFELYEGIFAEKHLSANLDVEGPLPKVLADPDKLTQILMNLVSNAIKFTPNRGEIRVKLELLGTGNAVRIAVSDTGIGIREADLNRIFSKFEQVKSARQSLQGPKGTGLGLAVSRALVELHGSELQVSSRWGEGSTFHFTLPVAAVAEPMTLEA